MNEPPTLAAAPDPAPSPEKATKKKAVPTEYVILEKTAGGDWIEAGNETAQGTDAAIRKHLGDTVPANGLTLVAVPARSWKPKTMEVEQTTTVRLV
jgi:hypothetical protein